jgi:hypothetical protein
MSSEVGEHPVLWRVQKVMNLFEKKKTRLYCLVVFHGVESVLKIVWSKFL